MQNIWCAKLTSDILLLLSSVKEDEENEFLLPLNHHTYAYVYPLTHTATAHQAATHVSFLLAGRVGRISGCIDAAKGSLRPSQPRQLWSSGSFSPSTTEVLCFSFLCLVLQASLNKLMETLGQSEPYFVKCIRSNAEKV